VDSGARLAFVGTSDLRDLLVPVELGGRKLARTLTTSGGPSSVVALELPVGGWASTLERIRSNAQWRDGGGAHFVLVSVLGELQDPSPDPREALDDLARFLRARDDHLVVLNASSLVGVFHRAADRSRSSAPLDLQVRRLNLVAMVASHVNGLSILDADRVVAETVLPGKVIDDFEYALEVCEALHASLLQILSERGMAGGPVLEVRVPFMRQASHVSVARWLKSEGEVVSRDEPICELRIGELRFSSRPTSAVVLASINGSMSLARRLARGRQVQRPVQDAVVSLMACDEAILRRRLHSEGTSVAPGDALALLSRDADAPLGRDGAKFAAFRAVARTDDKLLEGLL
jgi:hypothetical protein